MSNNYPIPLDFVEGNLILLPKQEGPVGPDKFRPITVSNSDYRLSMGIWAKYLAQTLSTWVSKPQRALLPKRFIRECVEEIGDTWMQKSYEKKMAYLLQTDFAKAFDYVNRDAIKYITKKINLPLQMQSIIHIALTPATTYICSPNTKPTCITVTNGVKQGCPVSPLVFIMIEDILVNAIEKIPKIQAFKAYADDLGILLDEKMNGLKEIGETITIYCNAVGAQLNPDKCSFTSTLDNNLIEKPEKPWSTTPFISGTKYLGIPIMRKATEREKWNCPLKNAAIVANKLHSLKSTLRQRCLAINTYIISLFSYLQRHYIIPRSVANKISHHIRFALGPYNYLPDRVLFTNNGPFKLKQPILHPFFMGIAILSLSPTVKRPHTTRNICNKTIYWHQNTARNIVDNILHIKVDKAYSYEDDKAERKQTTRALRATLIRSLPNGCSWKLIDQVVNAQRKIFIINIISLTSMRLKKAFTTLLCKGWYLNHQYNRKKGHIETKCSLCKEENESYKHILEECKETHMLFKKWDDR
jgi:hypothetical protein